MEVSNEVERQIEQDMQNLINKRATIVYEAIVNLSPVIVTIMESQEGHHPSRLTTLSVNADSHERVVKEKIKAIISEIIQDNPDIIQDKIHFSEEVKKKLPKILAEICELSPPWQKDVLFVEYAKKKTDCLDTSMKKHQSRMPKILIFHATKYDAFDIWLKRQPCFIYFPSKITKENICKRILEYIQTFELSTIPSIQDVQADSISTLLQRPDVSVHFDIITKEIIKKILECPTNDKVNFKSIAQETYYDMAPKLGFGDSSLCQNMITYTYRHPSNSIADTELENLLKQTEKQAYLLSNTTLDMILFTGGHGSTHIMGQMDQATLKKMISILSKYGISTKAISADSCYSAAHITVFRTILNDNYNSYVLANQGVSQEYLFRKALLAQDKCEEDFNTYLSRNLMTNPTTSYYDLDSNTIFLLSNKTLINPKKQFNFFYTDDNEALSLEKLGIKVVVCNFRTLQEKLKAISYGEELRQDQRHLYPLPMKLHA